MNKDDLIEALYKIEAIKFGSFKLKSGLISPIYLDLRLSVSYPKILASIANLMWQEVSDLQFDLICGVPYTALPIATAMSLSHAVPMIMRRKEVKDYGTRRAIEGHWQDGQRCLIIEDLVTSGISVSETIEPIKKEGIEVSDITVLIDRQQGGRQHLERRGYRLHSVLTITEILDCLKVKGLISQDTVREVTHYITENQTAAPILSQ